MAGKIELLTPSNGKVALVGEDTATDVTVTVPARTGNVAVDGPAFSAYQNAATSLSQNTTTKLNFQVEDYDTANCFASSRFTPNVAGYYLVTGAFQVGTTAGKMQLLLYKNGSPYRTISQSEPSSGFTYGTCYVYLNGSTDYAELYANQNQATQNTLATSNTYFQAAMIRGA